MYLGKVVDFKAQALSVTGPAVHVVTHQQHQLQYPVELAALLHFLQRSGSRHYILHKHKQSAFIDTVAFTRTVNITVFRTIQKWVQCSPMVLFTHTVKRIKGDVDGTCERALSLCFTVTSLNNHTLFKVTRF